ncbi:RagB/SusD family nutrient uptake outer membrane protein [Bacteroides sedimenti]
MKKFKSKSIYSLLLIALFSTSCDDGFLDKKPLDKLSNDSFWTSENDVVLGLNACYPVDNYWNTFWFDGLSDNAFSQFAWDGIQNIGNGTADPVMTAQSDARNEWDFKKIRICNNFLENIDRVTLSDAKAKEYKGQARFIRAYEYFWRSQIYGDFPLVTKTLGVKESFVPRNLKSEVVDFILSELNEISAPGYLPLSYSGDDKGRITRGAALALKARVELYNKKYAEAATSAKAVMDLNLYELFPDYEKLFWEESESKNKEAILEQQFSMVKDDYKNWMEQSIGSRSAGGWSSVAPVQSLVDAYECTDGKRISESPLYNPEQPYQNRDPRLKASIICPGDTWQGVYDPYSKNSSDNYKLNNASPTCYQIRKYMNPSESTNDGSGANVMCIRFAEVLLTYAEARIELGSIDQTVLDAINSIRARAYGVTLGETTKYPAITTFNQEELRTIVRNERRVELALEGLRWYDIQRWEIGPQVMPGTVYGARLGTVDENGNLIFTSPDHLILEQRSFDPAKNYLWPVPQKERDVNPKITQNPGY